MSIVEEVVGKVREGRDTGVYANSLISAQFCCEPKLLYENKFTNLNSYHTHIQLHVILLVLCSMYIYDKIALQRKFNNL